MKNRFTFTVTLGIFYNLIDNFFPNKSKFVAQFTKEELVELREKIDIILSDNEKNT